MRLLAPLCALVLFVIAAAQAQEPLFPGDRTSFDPKTIDVNYPDGSEVKGGTTIKKTWKVRNSGSVAWKDRELRIAGDAQGFTVKPVAFSGNPGKEVDISVTLTLPKQPGRYKVTFKQWAKDSSGQWKLAFPDRYRSGVYIDVVVK